MPRQDTIATASNSSRLKANHSKWVIDAPDNEDDDFTSNPDSTEAYVDLPTTTKSELKPVAGRASSVDVGRVCLGSDLTRLGSQRFNAHAGIRWYG